MPTSLSRSASPCALATLDKVAARTPAGVTLFDNLSLTFGPERTGVVGRNGAGKSTLLRLISGDLSPTEGAVTRVGTIGMLDQRHDPAPSETVAQTLGVGEGLAVIERALAGEGDAEDLANADWTLELRIAEVLAEVGLAGLGMDRSTISLSGGEQTRLRLAGLLLARPDMILLDEPTNHLDLHSVVAVENALRAYDGALIVVSHDSDFLDAIGIERTIAL